MTGKFLGILYWLIPYRHRQIIRNFKKLNDTVLLNVKLFSLESRIIDVLFLNKYTQSHVRARKVHTGSKIRETR